MKKNFSRTVFALALPLATLVACGSSNDHGVSFDPNPASIVSGQAVKASDPVATVTVALLIQNDQGTALCSGSLIAADTVLTAAHCLDETPSNVMVIFARKLNGSDDSEHRTGSSFVQNPNWKSGSPETLGDLGLIHFEGGLPSGYTTVTLADSDSLLKTGATVLLAGYGVTNGQTHTGVGVLRETQTQIEKMRSATQVVTDGTQTSVCFGDSGGPAFIKSGSSLIQWGVASAVTSEACKTTSIHTSVVSYRDWIAQASASLRQN